MEFLGTSTKLSLSDCQIASRTTPSDMDVFKVEGPDMGLT